MENPWIRQNKLEQFMGESLSSIRSKYIDTGLLTPWKDGGVVRYLRDEVIRAMNQRAASVGFPLKEIIKQDSDDKIVDYNKIYRDEMGMK